MPGLTCRAWQLGYSELLPLSCLRSQAHDIVFVDTEQNVLRLNVCMDDGALVMKVVQPLQRLAYDGFDAVQGDALVVGTNYQFQEVTAENLKHHTDVCSANNTTRTLTSEYNTI